MFGLPKDAEKKLKEGNCPVCGGDKFLRGPEGGLGVKVECERCGSDFNVGPGAAQFIGVDHSGRWIRKAESV